MDKVSVPFGFVFLHENRFLSPGMECDGHRVLEEAQDGRCASKPPSSRVTDQLERGSSVVFPRQESKPEVEAPDLQQRKFIHLILLVISYGDIQAELLETHETPTVSKLLYIMMCFY